MSVIGPILGSMIQVCMQLYLLLLIASCENCQFSIRKSTVGHMILNRTEKFPLLVQCYSGDGIRVRIRPGMCYRFYQVATL